MKEITVCLTACGRPDLLAITLESFFKFNTYPIKNFYIYEDSGTDCNRDVELKYANEDITWMFGESRAGQIIALDRLWEMVSTEYFFSLEEDWEFLKPGFIEESMKIMEAEPKVLQVRLCSLEKFNQHPVRLQNGIKVLKNSNELWSGTNFNPSLRRKSDYDLIAPFSKHTTFNRKKPWKSEAVISKIYNQLGFKAALLEGYIQHTGNERHVY